MNHAQCMLLRQWIFIYVRLEFECHHSSLGILSSVITVHCWVLYIYSSCHAVLVVPYFVDAPIAVQNCSSVVSFLNDLVCMEHWFFFNTLSKSWFFSTGACIYLGASQLENVCDTMSVLCASVAVLMLWVSSVQQRTRASWPTKVHGARKRRTEAVRHRLHKPPLWAPTFAMLQPCSVSWVS